MEWVDASLNQFCLWDDTPDDKVAMLLKPVGELALTADIILRHSTDRQTVARAHEWLSFAWAQVKEGELIARLLNRYPDLFALCTLYPSFRRHGLTNGKIDDAIAAMLTLRGIKHHEFPPWRALDIALALKDLGHHPPWSPERIVRATWLWSTPEPWSLSDSAAYSVTHTVFYITKFGTTPSALPRRIRRYLSCVLPMWTSYYVAIGNMDLLAEMLMVASNAGVVLADSPEWEQLQSKQHTDGSVNGPYGSGASLDPYVRDVDRIAFLASYHTTLVALMASAMRCAQGGHNAQLGRDNGRRS